MTIQERAKAIAEYANTCCMRSDGYEEEVEKFAVQHLEAVLVEAMDEAEAKKK